MKWSGICNLCLVPIQKRSKNSCPSLPQSFERATKFLNKKEWIIVVRNTGRVSTIDRDELNDEVSDGWVGISARKLDPFKLQCPGSKLREGDIRRSLRCPLYNELEVLLITSERIRSSAKVQRGVGNLNVVHEQLCGSSDSLSARTFFNYMFGGYAVGTAQNHPLFWPDNLDWFITEYITSEDCFSSFSCFDHLKTFGERRSRSHPYIRWGRQDRSDSVWSLT